MAEQCSGRLPRRGRRERSDAGQARARDRRGGRSVPGRCALNASINSATFRRYRRQGISPVRSHFPQVPPSTPSSQAASLIVQPRVRRHAANCSEKLVGSRKGGVVKEGKDHGKGSDRGFRLSFFPVKGGRCGRSELCAGRCLCESTLEPSLPDMLAEGLRLDLGFLCFQTLERDRGEWQKGNASLSLWLSGTLFRYVPLHPRPGGALPPQDLRTAPRPHRSAHRSAGRPARSSRRACHA